MAAQVKILVEGYTNADSKAKNGAEKSCSTVTLVKDGGIIIVVDPGTLESQQVLVDALSKEGLGVKDINIVCITHSHIDHYGSVGMFPEAKTLEFFGLWSKGNCEDWNEQFTKNIKIIKTPGHDYTGITLLVNTDKGTVAICGDIFWKENFPKKPQDDAFASSPQKLMESREIVIKMSDWVIPGHGGIFKTNKEVKPEKYHEVFQSKEAREIALCRKCGRLTSLKDKCLCRQWLCYECCECDMDCNFCSCSHKKG